MPEVNPNPVTAGAPPSQDTTQPLLRSHRLMGSDENMKNVFDKVTLELFGDADLRDVARARARLSERSERNGIAFDKAMDTVVTMGFQNLLATSQTGQTTEQTASGPEHTAEGSIDTANAAVGTANAQVAANIAQLASALVPIITSAGGIVTAQSLAALLPVVVAAAGSSAGTSTSSTTK